LPRNPFKQQATTAKMCRHCSHMPFASHHAETACPYAASFFCAHCSNYGHQTSTCPNPRTLFTEPQFIEQLIPTHLLTQYNLTTTTPFKAIKPTATTTVAAPAPVYLELPDDDTLIRKYLANQGYKTFSSKAKELRKELEAHCQKTGLVWKKIDLF
jgi:hypothetical protein